ncbi:glycosyltransferase family 2 protein [Candidatus Dojkabacteria bacterium]|nr:glycosyltransferase family 2 protein [Candidatus Dojkabacteria bacterium]
MKLLKTYIALPAYNESKVIGDVISTLKNNNFENVVVVDDGSSDNTGQIASKYGATVFTHVINRGKGAATKTAIEACLRLGADYVITMDSDGQHVVDDIKKMDTQLRKSKFDVILGSRFIDTNNIPKIKVVYNMIANLVTYLLFGIWVSDSQSGLRGYTAQAADKISDVGDQYEYETEIIREIGRNNLKYKEIPIKVLYTKYSQNKLKRQSLLSGINTFFRLIFKAIS